MLFIAGCGPKWDRFGYFSASTVRYPGGYQIEIWFCKLQSKLLRPNDYADVPTLTKAIMEFMVYCNQREEPIKWTYTAEKLERKLATNL